jgi:hypothetical protein
MGDPHPVVILVIAVIVVSRSEVPLATGDAEGAGTNRICCANTPFFPGPLAACPVKSGQ